MKRYLWVLMVLFLGCGTVTPAVREAVDVVSCRYDAYVLRDAALSDAEKDDRLRMSRQLRDAVGIQHEAGCPDYGR